MQELNWLKSHIGSMSDAIDLANQFYWHITIEEIGKDWVVKSGEKIIIRSNSKDSIDAFLYGLALGYSIIPDSMVKEFREIFDIDNQ